MRLEKKYINAEYVARLNRSPFFIVADYTGLKVQHFSELRKRLRKTGAEIHVVKNTIFKIAARETGIADLGGSLTGQIAVVTGSKDISAAAKVLKTFVAEFEKPKIRFGVLDNKHLDAAALATLADLPSIEVLRSQLLGVLQAPASKLVRTLNEPAAQLARVLQAKADKAAA
jgi:large subunit ribosomal protein L10